MSCGTAFLLTFILLYLPCCNGDELTLFVHPSGNRTTCPPATDSANCKLLSDYARDLSLSLDSNTSFVFLPGDHVLDVQFFVDSSDMDLLLTPMEPGNDVHITCEKDGSFIFTSLHSVEVMFLTFHSCNISGDGSGTSTLTIFFMLDIQTVIVRHCIFTNNTASALQVTKSTVLFIGNQVSHNFGHWMLLESCSARFTDNIFTNNDASAFSFITAGLSVYMSSLTTTGTNVFNGNSGVFGGTMYGFNSTINLGGNATFVNNRGTVGGVLIGASLQVIFSGSVYFENNMGTFGGVLGSLNSEITISGEVALINNYASYGGAFYIVSSTVTFINKNNATFASNTAINGGAIFLASGASINFLTSEPGYVTFLDNFANLRGGAIFIQDSNALSYCLGGQQQNIAVQECSFTITDYVYDETVKYQTRMYFFENYAVEAGTAIYGGALDSCILETNNDATVLSGLELFDQIADYSDNNIQSIGDNGVNSSSIISSDPFVVCACNGSEPNCAMTSLSRTIYPGAVMQVSVVAFGQRNGTVPATILAIEHDLAIEDLEIAQGIPSKCSNLSYTVYAHPGNASLGLFAGGACLTQGIGLTIEFKVLSCPPGFATTTIAKNKEACTCDSRLVRYTNTCNPEDGTVLRGDSFWMGFDQDSDGIILYPICPFDYCITDEISLKVEDSDAQCNNNREGILCGQCSDGLSIVLGSSRCERCSDSYLALLLFFAAAGVILVAFLLLLNLSVAVGTINGLIFYANIVAANLSLVYPSEPNTYLDILKVFIAWINLDFGIESCFYDGMDTYANTWLQYAFPFYIWTLMGLVFLVSHCSTTASKYLGTNPIAVFATLILLSYTKLLRIIIEAFSSASLDYPDGETRLVWLYDGNVPFLDVSDGRHLGLFIASLLILIFLFIPYTLLLLTSQWLQIKSHWKILSWLNKPQLRAFLDAYHAPYKPRHRYWTGLLLLIRFALLITSAHTMAANPSVNFLVVQVFVLLVLVWALINGGIYKKWYLNMLEAFFFLNLGLLAASTHHVKFEFATLELSSAEYQRALAITSSTSITIAVLAFVGTIVFHIYQKKAFRRRRKFPASVEMKESVGKAEKVTVTSSSVSLREPLLDES